MRGVTKEEEIRVIEPGENRAEHYNYLAFKAMTNTEPMLHENDSDLAPIVIVFTDGSVEWDNQAMANLYGTIETFGCEVAGPKAILEDRESIEHGGGLEPYPIPQAKQGLDSAGHHGQVGPDSFVSGAMMAVDRLTLIKHGMLDESFREHYLFTDYCFNVRQRGGRVAYCGQSKVYWPGEPLKALARADGNLGINDQYVFWRKWIGNRTVYADMVSEVHENELRGSGRVSALP